MRHCLLLLALIPLALRADERSVIPGGAGPNRLDPDPAVLSRARPLRYSDPKLFTGGLDDLRLRSAGGSEMAYILVAPQTTREEWIRSSILPVRPTKTTSGFEADFGSVRNVDKLRFEGIARPFMKRLTLEGSGDRVHYTLLARDATVFDLPGEKLRYLDVGFEPGEYRYLRVTWNDRASAVVRSVGAAAARVHRESAPEEGARIGVPFRRVSSEPGRSRYRLQLPGPHLPIAAIDLTVANDNVLREASVAESRLSGSELMPIELGSSTLRKTSRGGASASNLGIPILFPEGADLDLTVDDGNNLPLAIDRIDARFAPLPWIYFESADGNPLVATYGDPALHAPRYDLEAMRKSLGRVTALHAAWGPAAPKQSYAPTTGDGLLRGAPLRPKDFRFSRPIPAAAPGVVRLLLDADVLARSADIADVRIVDANHEQVPFLVERRSDPLILDLKLSPRTERDRRSVYQLILPYDSLPLHTKIVFTTTAHVFSREAELQRVNDDSPRDRQPLTLAAATWSSGDPEHEPPSLTFDVPLTGMRSVELAVDEGDNAPLPIASARMLIPSVALRFYDPGAPLTLLYGNPNANAPRYDLELLASRVFAASARDLTLPPAHAARPERASSAMKFFWVAIVAVVLVLLAILARLIAGHAAASS